MTGRRGKFWIKLMIYLLPFTIGFMALTGTLVYMGESMPLRWVVWHQQQDDNVLFRYRYGNRDPQFKQLATNVRQPEVLAIGSSRILQFRAGFFSRNPDAFYNAAGPAWELEQVIDLVTGLDRDALPGVLILAIDPPWFHDDYDSGMVFDDVSDFANLFIVNRSFIQDVLTGERFDRDGFDTSAYWQRVEPGTGGLALGLRAIRDGHGFRSDGSEQYGDFLVAGWLWQPQQRENHLNMMRSGEDMYIYGDTISETRLQALDELLTFAAEHEIYVIGFLPSYMPSLWDEMTARGNHSYITALTPRLAALFDVYGFPFFDFSNGAWIGVEDEEFFDGWHASELGNLRLYQHMLDALPEVLGLYSDRNVLGQIAAAASDTWAVFDSDNRPR
jgi:hypothetical protein